MNPLRMGIVGSGRLGGFHANKAAAHEKVELVGIYDINRENAQAAAEKFNCRVFDSLETLAETVQAAVIAVPSVLHCQIARVLLEKGVSLLIEKPMTVNSTEAAELMALAEKSNAKIMVGHTEQYNPVWEPAKQLLGSGIPCFIDARRTSGYTFRSTDIGVILDLMIHDLELVLSAIPEEITRIDAFGFLTIGGFEDFAQARLTFANGTVANLTASRVEHEAVRRMGIWSAYETKIIDFASRTATTYLASSDVRAGKFAPEHIGFEEIAKIQPTFMQTEFQKDEVSFPAVDALTLEMADFVEMALCQTPPKVPAAHAAWAIEVAEKILAAMK